MNLKDIENLSLEEFKRIKLAAINRKRAELDAAEQELKGSLEPKQEKKKRGRKVSNDDGSKTVALRNLLAKYPQGTTTEELSEKSGIEITSVRWTMTRLMKAKEVESIPTGGRGKLYKLKR